VERLRDKLILIAAADEAIRDAVGEEFSRLGCEVISAPGGFEAYELARARSVDAVLAASRLSSGEAGMLLSDVRRLNHDVPVILFGAAEGTMSQTEAFHRGFAAYFPHATPVAALAAAAARSLEFVEERKKKKVERVTVAASGELTFGDPPTTTTVNAPVLNLSRGGMFLSLERGFPPLHCTVTFLLTFPPEVAHPEIKGRAFVRWVRERPASGHLAGIGLEFTELNPEAQVFIDRYVDRLSTRR
jgi:CheY-like chemotaxis protein